MPNPPVPAAAEGLPSSRRVLLVGLAMVPFAAAPVATSLADRPSASTDPHVARQVQALALYRRSRETDWGWGTHHDSPACKAADEAFEALMSFADDACEMPAPATLAGLGALAFTLALANERFANPATEEPDQHMLRSLIVAVLHVSGVAMPPEFRGLVYHPEQGECGA